MQLCRFFPAQEWPWRGCCPKMGWWGTWLHLQHVRLNFFAVRIPRPSPLPPLPPTAAAAVAGMPRPGAAVAAHLAKKIPSSATVWGRRRPRIPVSPPPSGGALLEDISRPALFSPNAATVVGLPGACLMKSIGIVVSSPESCKVLMRLPWTASTVLGGRGGTADDERGNLSWPRPPAPPIARRDNMGAEFVPGVCWHGAHGLSAGVG